MFYDGCLVDAVRAARAQLEGHYAFIATHRDEPGLLVGTRHQCPLLAGMGDGEAFLASSITAFSGDTRRIKLIKDDEIVAIDADGVRVFDAGGDSLERDEIVVPWDDEVAEKGGYESYMLKEIHEQPAAISATIARNLQDGPLDLAGSATSRTCAGSCRWPAAPRTTRRWSAATRSSSGPASRATSRSRASGATATRGSSRARSSSASRSPARPPTRSPACGWRASAGRGRSAITNSPSSQITREVDAVLHTHAGLEMGVAATKTFTTQVVAAAAARAAPGGAQRRDHRPGARAPARRDPRRCRPRC